MMTLAEVNMRVAHNEWLEAKRQWALALQAINIAKQEWEQAQAEFYQDKNIMSSAAGCGGCIGRRSG